MGWLGPTHVNMGWLGPTHVLFLFPPPSKFNSSPLKYMDGKGRRSGDPAFGFGHFSGANFLKLHGGEILLFFLVWPILFEIEPSGFVSKHLGSFLVVTSAIAHSTTST